MLGVMSRIIKEDFVEKEARGSVLEDDTLPRIQSPSKQLPVLPILRAGELGSERCHRGQGHPPDRPERDASGKGHTDRQRQGKQGGGEEESPLCSSSVSGPLSKKPERGTDDGHRQRQQRGARKSLVDRQSESLGWSTEASIRASTERGRRASDAPSPRPSRRGSSQQDCSGDSHRRRSASAAVAAMPRSSSSSGAGFFGSFDDSRYWDFAFRFTQRQDIGNQCRECKRPFLVLNEEIAVRRSDAHEKVEHALSS